MTCSAKTIKVVKPFEINKFNINFYLKFIANAQDFDSTDSLQSSWVSKQNDFKKSKDCKLNYVRNLKFVKRMWTQIKYRFSNLFSQIWVFQKWKMFKYWWNLQNYLFISKDWKDSWSAKFLRERWWRLLHAIKNI